MSKINEKEAKIWLYNLDATHLELIQMGLAVSWGLKACNEFMNLLDKKGNLYSIKTKGLEMVPIPPFPHSEDKSFCELGERIDNHIKLINTLLPDGDE